MFSNKKEKDACEDIMLKKDVVMQTAQTLHDHQQASLMQCFESTHTKGVIKIYGHNSLYV